MSSVNTWRRVALASYITAGTALTLASYALGTTAANARALDSTEERIQDYRREQRILSDNSISGQSVQRGTLPPDTRPYLAPDWPTLAENTMPSVIALSAIEQPYGFAENSQAWLIPGVQQNAATAALTHYRAWQKGWAKQDAKRQHQTICGGFVIEGNRVLTAAHCVDRQEALRIRTAGGEWRAAHVVGADVTQDVALLEFEGDPLPPIKVANTLPRPGQDVMAIGSPSGYGFAVGVGIVAWHGLDAKMLSPNDFMLVTASVVGGNSGGVVVNTHGEAVSLVSYGSGSYTQTVPIDRALTVAGQLAK